jgi:hypothetical protein
MHSTGSSVAPRAVLLSTAIALVLHLNVRAQEKYTTGPASTNPTPAPAPALPLLNEWLRNQNTNFASWDFGGQFRSRYEVKEDGGSFPNRDFRKIGVDNDNSYFLLREKLHAGYDPGSWFSIYAEARDSSSSGDDRNPNVESDQFDLHQGFVRLGNAQLFPLSLKIGRQELLYGDERLLGNSDWANVPRSFDAAKMRFESSNFSVDGFAGRVVLPVNHHFNVANDYDWLFGVYASTVSLIPRQETQLYFLSRNASASASSAVDGSLAPLPGPRDIYSLGLRVKSLPAEWHGWDYTAEIVGQLGSINYPVPGVGARRLDHEALAATVGGGYTWTKSFATPRLSLEYNFSSGDHDPTDGVNETFDNLFPTNHKLYGYMDFFSWRNMHNPKLSLGMRPLKSLLVTLDYHLFWLADTHDFFYPIAGAGRGATSPTQPGEPASYGRNPGFDSFVGSELDLDATWTMTRWAGLRVGYGHFFAGNYVDRSLSAVGGATDADFVYAQLTLTF